MQLQERLPQIEEKGAGALGISVAADFQARHLAEKDVTFPLLLDPDRSVRYLYKGETLGDYPPIEDVIAQL